MGENKIQIVIEAKDAASVVFRSMEKTIEDMARQGENVSDRLGRSFKTLNLRSALDIEKEKVKLKVAFDQIKASGVASAGEIQRAHKAMKSQLSDLNKEMSGGSMSMLSLRNATGALSGALATVGIGAVVKDTINAALQMQKLETSFRSIAGSNAGREFAFVREEASRLGLDLSSAAGEYGKLAAAAKGTALEGEETRKIFSAVSEAATALGLSGEETAGALNALQQMISKGKVSAEELRQQLGERLPGAFQLAARAMGVSTAELDKMMEQGQLTADDLLPKLAAALHDTYGVAAVDASGEGQAAINRFNNEMLESKAAVGASLMPAFTDILKGIKPISEGLMWLLQGFSFIGPVIGMTIDKLRALTRAPIDGFDATVKKMDEIENNFYATVADIQKRYGEQADSSKKTSKEVADEEERNAARRAEAAKKTGLDQAKSAESYAKAVGDTDEQLTAKYEKAYQERKTKVEAFYDAQIKAAGNNKAALQDLEIAKFNDLNRLAEQHKGDAALKEMDKQAAALAAARKAGEERIALIELQIAQGARAETSGAAEIVDIRRKQQVEEYRLALERAKHMESFYGTESEEYKKAQEAKLEAARKMTQAEIELAQAAEKARQDTFEKSSIDYQLELDKRLDWLRDSERDGLITTQQACRDKLEAEANYLGQIADLRARELAATAPDTVEYKRALAEKYAADREYYEKKKQLDDQVNAEILARHQQQAADIETDSQQSMASFRSFAQWFYAQWDVITERVTSLGPKMAAAFGTPLEMSEDTIEGLRVKMEQVAEATRKAAEMARDYFQFSRLLGEHARDAEQLRYEFYSQKLTLAELTEQLKKMTYATDEQLRRSSSLVNSLNLIDDSDLSNVRSEIERLTSAMKEAEEQARDTVDSLRDELDQMLGNKEAIENRDYETKRADLEQKLKDAQAAGNLAIAQEYQEALQLLEEIHQRKLDTIREEAEAARIAAEKQHTEELQRIEDEKKAREKALKSGDATNPQALGFALGGRIPGPDSPVDNIWVKARTGEWFVRNEAAHYWGDAFMSGINDPMSDIGRRIQERMSGVVHAFTAPVFAPKLSFDTGGPVMASERAGKGGHTFNIYTTEPVDDRLVRRKIIPEIERYEKRKR